MKRNARIPFAVAVLLVVVCCFALYRLGVFSHQAGDGQATAAPASGKSGSSSSTSPDQYGGVDPTRSYRFLTDICAIGSRTSGTDGMRKQQEMLQAHFKKLGAKVSMQNFRVRHPLSGDWVPMANMIVTWHPERKDRVLLCAHYDTRPFPDRDPDRRKRQGLFVGANDGASGTAVLCELGHHVAKLPGRFGVDFVLFDGEELVYDDRRHNEWYFQGATIFSRQYVQQPPAHKYHFGVLLDMVGDAELHLYYEQNSMQRPNAARVMQSIWSTAERLGVDEFVARTRHTVRDDHLPLNDIASIPTCDIIDFDYPRPGRLNYWHTTADVPKHCSGESLAKVGWVVLTWLRDLNSRN